MNDRRISCYRYIDDFVILGPTRRSTERAFRSAHDHLRQFGFTAYHPSKDSSKGAIGRTNQGINFLGCITDGITIRPNAKAKERLLLKIDNLIVDSAQSMTNPSKCYREKRSLVATLNEISHTIEGWGNQYSFCNDISVLQSLDAKIDERLRRYIGRYASVVGKTSKVQTRSRCQLLGVHILS